MSDRIAISAYNAAYLMLDYGLTIALVQEGINSIKQPSNGYYYATDVMDYIRGAAFYFQDKVIAANFPDIQSINIARLK